MVKVKGANLSSSLKSNEARFGKESFNKIIASLGEEDRKVLTSIILDSSWYPLDALVNFMEAIFKENYKGDRELFRKSVYDVTEAQLTGVYKSFLALGSIEKIIEQLGTITNRYFDGVTVKVDKQAEGKIKLTYTGYETKHAFYEISVQAWWEKVLDMLGLLKNIKVEISTSLSANKGILEYLITFEKK